MGVTVDNVLVVVYFSLAIACAAFDLSSAILASAVLVDLVLHGPLFGQLFALLHPIFWSYPRLRRLFNVPILHSDVMNTSRKHTRLALASVVNIVLRGLNVQFSVGNEVHIQELRKFQKKPQKPVEMYPHFQRFVGEKVRVSFEELESFIIDTWCAELTLSYGAPAFPDEAKKGLTAMRHLFQILLSNPVAVPAVLWTEWRNLVALRRYYGCISSDPLRLVLLVPFLTTVDSALLQFFSADNLTAYHQLFQTTPIAYVPIRSPYALLELRPNMANNAGNSVFGAKGFLCPGNTVTANLLQSIAEMKDLFEVMPEGQPVLREGGVIRVLENTDNLFVTIRAKSSPECTRSPLVPSK